MQEWLRPSFSIQEDGILHDVFTQINTHTTKSKNKLNSAKIFLPMVDSSGYNIRGLGERGKGKGRDKNTQKKKTAFQNTSNLNSYLNFIFLISSLLATGYIQNYKTDQVLQKSTLEIYIILFNQCHPIKKKERERRLFSCLASCPIPIPFFSLNPLVSMDLNKSREEYLGRTEASPLSKQTLSRGSPGRFSTICWENQDFPSWQAGSQSY